MQAPHSLRKLSSHCISTSMCICIMTYKIVPHCDYGVYMYQCICVSFLGQLSRCHTVRCAQPVCPRGIIYTPPHRCCPVCLRLSTLPLNCAYTLCAQPDCMSGEIYTPPGECCPRCRQTLPPHCAAVSCLRPRCGVDQELYTPAGQCCPRCRNKPSTVPASCAYTTCLANPTCPPGQELYRPPNECCYQCRASY